MFFSGRALLDYIKRQMDDDSPAIPRILVYPSGDNADGLLPEEIPVRREQGGQTLAGGVFISWNRTP